MNELEILRAPWEAKALMLVDRWKDTELEIITVERWQVERKAFYSEIIAEMTACGNDFFLPKALKLLVQIKTPSDRQLAARWEKGWDYCCQMAEMNEIEAVIKGLGLLDRIYQAMRGPYGYVIRGLEGGGFIVEVPEVPR